MTDYTPAEEIVAYAEYSRLLGLYEAALTRGDAAQARELARAQWLPFYGLVGEEMPCS